MGLNRYRNKPCQCGSEIKFKHCCLQDHYKQQAGLVTSLAKKIQEKTAKYFQKRYKKITKSLDEPLGIPHPCNDVNFKKTEGKVIA